MATYKIGSTGSSIKELQKMLNQSGYGLAEDGIYGNKTASAIRDYQTKSGLSATGIADEATLSKLGYSAPISLQSIESSQPTYTQSETLNNTYNTLKQYETNKPQAYESPYTDQIKGLLDKINNREAFNYDFNVDPLYQQYKDRYTQQGKLAMQDTMANAAALTGGYGNSYASTAGNQAYQGYLQQLNDVIPELQNAAYGKYRDENNNLYNQLSALQGQDQAEYGRNRDNVSDYYNDLKYYYSKYSDMSKAEYDRYLADIDLWLANRNYYYGKNAAENKRAGGGGSNGEYPEIGDYYDGSYDPLIGSSKKPIVDYSTEKDISGYFNTAQMYLEDNGENAMWAYLDKAARQGVLNDLEVDTIIRRLGLK